MFSKQRSHLHSDDRSFTVSLSQPCLNNIIQFTFNSCLSPIAHLQRLCEKYIYIYILCFEHSNYIHYCNSTCSNILGSNKDNSLIVAHISTLMIKKHKIAISYYLVFSFNDRMHSSVYKPVWSMLSQYDRWCDLTCINGSISPMHERFVSSHG